jgi:hypothetical protein
MLIYAHSRKCMAVYDDSVYVLFLSDMCGSYYRLEILVT